MYLLGSRARACTTRSTRARKGPHKQGSSWSEQRLRTYVHRHDENLLKLLLSSPATPLGSREEDVTPSSWPPRLEDPPAEKIAWVGLKGTLVPSQPQQCQRRREGGYKWDSCGFQRAQIVARSTLFSTTGERRDAPAWRAMHTGQADTVPRRCFLRRMLKGMQLIHYRLYMMPARDG